MIRGCLKSKPLSTICMKHPEGCSKNHMILRRHSFFIWHCTLGRHTDTLSHYVVVTASTVEHWLETKITNWRCWRWQKIHPTYLIQSAFLIFTRTLTLSQCMWMLSIRSHTSTQMHTSTWNPFLAVSQTNWQHSPGNDMLGHLWCSN